MKAFGKPLGYISNGALIGVVLGFFCVVRGQRFAVDVKALGLLLCAVFGALIDTRLRDSLAVKIVDR
jgi:hypothetical protein